MGAKELLGIEGAILLSKLDMFLRGNFPQCMVSDHCLYSTNADFRALFHFLGRTALKFGENLPL